MAAFSCFPYCGPGSSREWVREARFLSFPLSLDSDRSATAGRRVRPPFPLDYFLPAFLRPPLQKSEALIRSI
jgi:hypothetical protein